MNREVKSQIDYIRFVKTCNKLQRNYLIEFSTSEQLQALTDIIYNVLLGNCPLGKNIKSKLSKYKNIMRQIVEKKVTKKKRKILLKKLNLVLPLIIAEALKCI